MSCGDSGKLLYEFYKSHGVCVRCGQENAVSGKTKCVVCLEKDAESQRKCRAKKSEEELRRLLEKDKAYKRERYQKFKAAGLCVTCSKPRSPGSKIYCIDCAIKNQRRNSKRRCSIERYGKSAYGKCYVCNEPVGKNGTMCDRCYAMVCSNLPKRMKPYLWGIQRN